MKCEASNQNQHTGETLTPDILRVGLLRGEPLGEARLMMADGRGLGSPELANELLALCELMSLFGESTAK